MPRHQFRKRGFRLVAHITLKQLAVGHVHLQIQQPPDGKTHKVFLQANGAPEAQAIGLLLVGLGWTGLDSGLTPVGHQFDSGLTGT